MSHFYGTVNGGRSIASRTGHIGTGISSHTRGWSLGIKVHGYAQDGQDCFAVSVSGGSNNDGTVKSLGTIRETENGAEWVRPDGTVEDIPFA